MTLNKMVTHCVIVRLDMHAINKHSVFGCVGL